MVIIDFKNIQCLKTGKIKIKEKAVNVKYSYNGFGKSSLAKAIYYGIEDIDSLSSLSPFSGGEPYINNVDSFKSCKIFNEDFVRNTLFQSDNLIEESYSVFIENKDLQEKEKTMNRFLENLDDSLVNGLLSQFVSDSEEALRILVLNKNADDFDKRKPGYKGLSKAPNISSAALLTSIKDFDNIVKSGFISEWLEWHQKGHAYIFNEKCPFCNVTLSTKQINYKNDIETLVEGMDFKNNKSVRDIVTNKVLPYLNAKDKTIISTLLNDVALEKDKKAVLIGDLRTINEEVSKIRTLQHLKNAKSELDNKQALIEIFSKNRLNEQYFGNISDDYKNAAIAVNKNISRLISSAEEIINESKIYKNMLENAVQQSNTEINTFLKTAGIPYEFKIDLIDSDNATTKLIPLGNKDYDLNSIKEHLSYGERNALSVALFGALAKSSNSDLIILDDPISSFDENKKFAIMNYLFNSNNGVLKEKTVILFTHDFEPVIETKNNVVDFDKKERFVTVLSKSEGTVVETEVHKKEIVNAYKMEEELLRNTSLDDYIRLIHLRKMYELENVCFGDEYDILSSAEHLRQKPSDKKGLEYDSEKVLVGESYIRKFIENFSYNDFVSRHSVEKLIYLYNNENDNYNKLILLRAMDEVVGFEIKTSNPILYNFMSINFHVESLYLYQIKGIDFIPQYIMDLCDHVVKTIENQTSVNNN